MIESRRGAIAASLIGALLVFGAPAIAFAGSSDTTHAQKAKDSDDKEAKKDADKKAADNPIFKEIAESQRVFAARTVKWDLDTNVSRRMAYNHYFNKPAAKKS